VSGLVDRRFVQTDRYGTEPENSNLYWRPDVSAVRIRSPLVLERDQLSLSVAQTRAAAGRDFPISVYPSEQPHPVAPPARRYTVKLPLVPSYRGPDLANMLENVDLDALFVEAGKESADGVRRLAHLLDDL
jgi:hypothetical protein